MKQNDFFPFIYRENYKLLCLMFQTILSKKIRDLWHLPPTFWKVIIILFNLKYHRVLNHQHLVVFPFFTSKWCKKVKKNLQKQRENGNFFEKTFLQPANALPSTHSMVEIPKETYGYIDILLENSPRKSYIMFYFSLNKSVLWGFSYCCGNTFCVAVILPFCIHPN